MLNGFKLSAETFQTESQTLAKISLTAKAGGDFELSTAEAKSPEG
jgi:predicted Rdx family selenoprotein